MRKGISPLISYLLYVGAGLVVVSIVATVGTGTIDTMRDSAEVEQMQTDLAGLSGLVDTVASSGQGTQLTRQLSLRRGSLHYENQSLVYEIRTPAEIVSSGTRQDFGRVGIASNAAATLAESTYQGTDCYRLENQYLETCIRELDEYTNTDFQDLFLYLEGTNMDTVVEPNMTVQVDGQDQDLQIWTRPAQIGRFLGEAVVRIQVKPDTQPAYTMLVKLRTGADFLTFEYQ